MKIESYHAVHGRVKNQRIEGVFIISDSLSGQEKETIVAQCLKSNIEIFKKYNPDYNQPMNGRLTKLS